MSCFEALNNSKKIDAKLSQFSFATLLFIVFPSIRKSDNKFRILHIAHFTLEAVLNSHRAQQSVIQKTAIELFEAILTLC